MGWDWNLFLMNKSALSMFLFKSLLSNRNMNKMPLRYSYHSFFIKDLITRFDKSTPKLK